MGVCGDLAFINDVTHLILLTPPPGCLSSCGRSKEAPSFRDHAFLCQYAWLRTGAPFFFDVQDLCLEHCYWEAGMTPHLICQRHADIISQELDYFNTIQNHKIGERFPLSFVKFTVKRSVTNCKYFWGGLSSLSLCLALCVVLGLGFCFPFEITVWHLRDCLFWALKWSYTE